MITVEENEYYKITLRKINSSTYVITKEYRGFTETLTTYKEELQEILKHMEEQ